MEIMEVDSKKMRNAKKRLEALKGYYWHLAVYIGVNSAITISKINRNMTNGESFGEAFWDFGTFAIWFFWGIGLIFHTIKIYFPNSIFSKDWEERQIKKYIERDRKEAEKFR